MKVPGRKTTSFQRSTAVVASRDGQVLVLADQLAHLGIRGCQDNGGVGLAPYQALALIYLFWGRIWGKLQVD